MVYNDRMVKAPDWEMIYRQHNVNYKNRFEYKLEKNRARGIPE